MANKQDVLKVLDMKLQERREVIATERCRLLKIRTKHQDDVLTKFCKKYGFTNLPKENRMFINMGGLQFSCTYGFGKDTLKRRIKGYDVSKLERKALDDISEQENSLRKKYREIQQQILLHGVNDELFELVSNF